MKVGVIGLGRFGRFWAEQLALHLPVVAYNRTQRDITLKGVKIVGFDELVTSDVIFLCTAISSLHDVLSHLAGHIGKEHAHHRYLFGEGLPEAGDGGNPSCAYSLYRDPSDVRTGLGKKRSGRTSYHDGPCTLLRRECRVSGTGYSPPWV